MNITYSVLERALRELTIEQIVAVDKEIGQKYPENRCYRYLCAQIIGEKQDEQVKADLLQIIEEQKNAPSGATNTGQGSEPDKHH